MWSGNPDVLISTRLCCWVLGVEGRRQLRPYSPPWPQLRDYADMLLLLRCAVLSPALALRLTTEYAQVSDFRTLQTPCWEIRLTASRNVAVHAGIDV